MDRRAFLLGALAAPIAAPAIAKAAAPAAGGAVRSAGYMIGEVGSEMILPAARLRVISAAPGIEGTVSIMVSQGRAIIEEAVKVSQPPSA